MSWLRDHFHFWVFPALRAAVEYPSATKEHVALVGTLNPVVQRDLVGREGSGPSELQKLRGLCQYLGVAYTEGLHESSVGSSWLQSPQRGKLHVTTLRRTLQAAEAHRKEHRCSRLLFPGRDVWTLHVLAQRRGLDSLFIPEVSRTVAGNGQALRKICNEYGVTGDELFVDTGFKGSIVVQFQKVLGKTLQCALMSQIPLSKRFVTLHSFPPLAEYPTEDPAMRPNQLFPNRRMARKEALDTEYLPKYWKTGTIKGGYFSDQGGDPVQYLSNPDEIVRTAVMTSKLWRGAVDFTT